MSASSFVRRPAPRAEIYNNFMYVNHQFYLITIYCLYLDIDHYSLY